MYVCMQICADLIMNADTEASVNIVCVKEPASIDQQQVEIIHCRGLDYPIHPTGLILKGKEKGM